MNLTIREFAEADREAVVDLWHECRLVRPWNNPHRDIDRKASVGDAMFLVAVSDGAVVGTVMAGYDGHRGWINYLAVDPQQQRGGIGLALMGEAERRLTECGCAKINLQIRRDNAAAVLFYERIGFVEDDAVSMGKRLIDDE